MNRTRPDQPPFPLTAKPLSEGEFVRLWTIESRKLHAFVMSLVPNWNEAEEVLQEVGTTAWEKRGDFIPGTSFSAWLRQIARFKALSVLKQRGRGGIPSDTLTELLAAEADDLAEGFDERQTALVQCIDKLSQKDRRLLQLRYGSQCKASVIADAVGRSVNAIYTALHRVHKTLHDCVTSRLEVAE